MLRKLTPHVLAAATVISLGSVVVASGAMAAGSPVYTAPFSKTAVGGYDVVSYFTPSGPLKGDPKFSTTWKGAEFRFANAANLARFKANPEAFAPQYGGYCAWAVARGYTAKGDPLAWKVVNGKLYLNYDANVQKRWASDIPGNIANGDRNWPKVLK